MSLGAVVEDYIRRFRPSSESELNWFRRQPNLETALAVAAQAVNEDGKRFSHQRRITPAAIKQAKLLLAANIERVRHAPNFGVLVRVMDEILGKAAGLGDLFVYDTALRVGAKLGYLPKQVFLHAGTKVGAAALGLDVKQRFLYVSDMPEELRVLATHEIEDVLCIYADVLAEAQRGKFKPPEFVRCYLPEDEEDS